MQVRGSWEPGRALLRARGSSHRAGMLLSAEDGPNPSLEASGFIAVKGLRVRPLLIGWGFFQGCFLSTCAPGNAEAHK